MKLSDTMYSQQLSALSHAAFWVNNRVIVTGGAGFLGSFVVEKLQQPRAREIIVPRVEQYDLTDLNAIQRLFKDAQLLPSQKQESGADRQSPKTIIIHLAALAGGMGATRARPAEFFS